MKKLRVLICDPGALVRRSIRKILESDAGYEVCGEVASGREAVERARAMKPDVLLLGLDLPGIDGLTAARQIRSTHPLSHVIILAEDDSEELASEILASGARGHLLKTDIERDLLFAVEAVARGRVYVTPNGCERLIHNFLQHMPRRSSRPQPSQLTPRQREILRLVAEGQTSKEIAGTLGISVKTADMHRSNVKKRLGLSSLTDVIRYAIRHHIIEA
jgi:DNA-binding NarL/FixJ family response regulator